MARPPAEPVNSSLLQPRYRCRQSNDASKGAEAPSARLTMGAGETGSVAQYSDPTLTMPWQKHLKVV